MVASEEKQLILPNWSSNYTSVLILLEGVALGLEIVLRIKDIVSYEIEGISVELIRARFSNGVDRCRGVLAVTGRHRAGLNLELFHGIGKRQGQIKVVERIVMRAAVQEIGCAIRQSSGYSESNRGDVLIRIQVPAGRVVCDPFENNQIDSLSVKKRQLRNRCVVRDLPDVGGFRFHHRRSRLNFDGCGRSSDLKSRIHCGVRVHLKDYALLYESAEAGLFDAKLVWAYRQIV